MSIKIIDIAKKCGVSKGTVDRALHNRPGINAETKKMIEKTIEEMGYTPDLLARSLVMGESKSIGLVIFDVKNEYFAQLVDSVVKHAGEKNYFVYVTLSNGSPETELAAVRHLIGRRVDGIIVNPVSAPEYFDRNIKSNIPIAAIGNRLSEKRPFVGIDDKKAAMEGVEKLKANGYKRIMYICPPMEKLGKLNLYAQEKRLAGVMEVMNQDDSGTEYIIVKNKQYYQAVDDLLDMMNKDKKKTAVFCSSDVYAFRLLKYIKTKSYTIPEDIGLMGFDHVEFTQFLEPQLDSINIPTDELGKCAVDLLIDMMEGKRNNNDIIVPHEIYTGESI